MEPDASQKDKRKGQRRCRGERPRFALKAHAKGSQTPVYDGTIEGGVETAGRESFSYARSGPASARPPTSTRSGTERPGSSAKWRNTLARRAAT